MRVKARAGRQRGKVCGCRSSKIHTRHSRTNQHVGQRAYLVALLLSLLGKTFSVTEVSVRSPQDRLLLFGTAYKILIDFAARVGSVGGRWRGGLRYLESLLYLKLLSTEYHNWPYDHSSVVQRKQKVEAVDLEDLQILNTCGKSRCGSREVRKG